MLKSEIQPGKDYALREKRTPGTPFQRVRIIEHVRGTKWKAEWIEPNPGLVHYVDSSQLITRWKDHKAFLKEEADEQRLRKHNEEVGYKPKSPVILAVEQVFSAVGDEVSFYEGCLSGPPDAVDRVRARAGVAQASNSPFSYVDRRGTLHLPFDEALELGRKFCAAEPAAVLVKAESLEREWASEAQRAGGEYLVGLLNEYRAGWALARQWAGHDAAIAQREAQIQKLERLVWDAVYALQKAGLDNEAAEASASHREKVSRHRRKSEQRQPGTPISCGRSAGHPRGRMTLRQIVRKYLSDYADRSEREIKFYGTQQSLRDTIELAALAKFPGGKHPPRLIRHPHQRRIPPPALEDARQELLGADLRFCRTFDDLHNRVGSLIRSIPGIGALAVYDISHRIGAKLGLEPEKVYLHAGTRDGARALGLDFRRPFLEVSELPRPLRRLKPYQIEDCLCIFKKEFRR